MSDQPIDLAERRRLRDAKRAAETAATQAPATSESVPTSAAKRKVAYAELHCLSDFSFQRGASSAAELFDRARKLGYAALAITDECSLAGIVRAWNASRDTGLPLIVGSEFTLADGLKLVVLVENQDGYSELCRLITGARIESPKGEYRIGRQDFRTDAPGLLALWLPRPDHPSNDDEAAWIKTTFPGRAWIAVELHRNADDAARLQSWRALGERHGLRLVAAGDVHMHVRRRRALQDVMTAIRLNTTVADAGAALFPNGERHLRRIEQLRSIHDDDLLAETLVVAARCTFKLDAIRYEYPHEVVPGGTDASTHLAALAWAGADWRWPQGYDATTRTQIEHELALIQKLEYEHFFLTVHDIVQWARSQTPEILCQGRGSAANSAVCYCLGITSIDPILGNLLFERFISEERNEPPDIDVDFEHERREEVIQYVFGKYGRHRAALAATVIMYRGKSAARDVGRALGLSDDQLNQLSDVYSYGQGDMVPLLQRLREAGFDPDSRLMRQIVVLVEELRGSPRHLSQHVGGFVISEHPLHTLVPVENAAMVDRTVIQWDKDDLESLRLLKVDCLALGMLTCLRKCFDLLREHTDLDYDLDKVPKEDPETYAMIQKADTIGVFQIESRAQMSMLPRLRPANFYDLVIEIAIVRPGPIEGGMVHPFLRRRAGLEKVDYPRSTKLEEANDVAKQGRIEKILGRTCGVPIFQEQVMKLVQEVAGFTPGEADQLRRSMGSWRNDGQVDIFREKIYSGMHQRGYGDFADRLYSQIKGFGSYGFPESHSASFALLAYASSWLKCHQPAAFACALLNSLPMGFYPPAQIVQDVRRHSVEVRPPDVGVSRWDSTLERVEDGFALRLGLRLVKGASEAVTERIVAARATRPFADIADLVRRAALSRLERDRLAEGGAFARLAGHRHQARWESAGAERDLPVLAGAAIREQRVDLRAPSTTETVLTDYRTLGLSLEHHPVGLIRNALEREHRRSSRVLATLGNGTPVRTAGLVTVRQRPPEAGGATFMTLEDEYGQINLVVWRDVAERYRRPLLESVLLGVDGELQQEQEVRHVIARRLYDLSHWLPSLAAASRDFH